MEIKSDEPASIVEETTPSFVVPKKELYTEDVLNAMNKYYKLKSDYEKKYKKTVKNIANNDLTSIAKKRRLISSIKPKCVKCKRDVGTIFSNKDRVLTAKCGDTITPCGLDIQIHRGSIMSESKAADYWQNEIENEKLNIIQTKLDFLFGFVSEEDSLTKFNEFKTNMSETIEEYTSAINYLMENEEVKKNIRLSNESLNKNLNLIKENIEKFTESQDIQYIKDSVEIHIKNLKPLVEFITNLKYKYYTVVYDEDNETYTLVKKTHTVSSIERVIDEEPKIIKYKL